MALILVAVLAACAPAPGTPTAHQATVEITPTISPTVMANTATPTPSPTATPTPLPTPTPTPPPQLAFSLPAEGGAEFLLFSAARRVDGGYISRGVYRYDLSTRQLTQISGEGTALQDVSPDGSAALISQGSLLFHVNLRDGAQAFLSDRLYPHGGQSARFVAGGSQVALIAGYDRGEYALWRIVLTEGKLERLTPPDAPAPIQLLDAPREDQVAWQAGDCQANGICQPTDIYLSGLDGSLSYDLTGMLAPEFSPAGNYVAYRYFNAEERLDLAVSPLNREWVWNLSMPAAPVTNFSHPKEHISDYAWSPDGRQLAALYLERSAYSGKLCCQRLFLAVPDTKAAWELPRTEGLHAHIRWSPDGKHLLLAATRPESGGYSLSFQRVDLPTHESTGMDKALALTSPDYQFLTRLEWVRLADEVSAISPAAVVVPAGGASSPAATTSGSPAATVNVSPTSVAGEAPLPPEQWRSWPVTAAATNRAREIYQRGMALGRNPHAFSKIGDCQGIKEVLMGVYDQPGYYYFTPQDAYLQEAVNAFRGSFNRDGMALMGGYDLPTLFDPYRANPDFCNPGETPLECEFRVHNPAFVIISMEVWYPNRSPETYAAQMRRVIEYASELGIVPILATKADNIEGNWSINLTTARLAAEYDLPLWNFWLAVQSLPNRGLDTSPGRNDGFHISYEAWPVRAFTALKSLDAVWRGVRGDMTGDATPPFAAKPSQAVFGVRDESGAPLGVYTYDFDAASQQQVADAGFDLLDLSPAGGLLLRRGAELYRASRDGSGLTLLTDELAVESRQAALFLTDGSGRIALIAVRGGAPALWLFDPAQAAWTPLAAEPAPLELLPAAQADGIHWRAANGTLHFSAWTGKSRPAGYVGAAQPVFGAPDLTAYGYRTERGESGLAFGSRDRQHLWTHTESGLAPVAYAWQPDGSRLAALFSLPGKEAFVNVLLFNRLTGLSETVTTLIGANPQVNWDGRGENLLLSITVKGGNPMLKLTAIQLDPVGFKTRTAELFGGDPAVFVSRIFWLP